MMSIATDSYSIVVVVVLARAQILDVKVENVTFQASSTCPVAYSVKSDGCNRCYV